ncbi:MAG: GNAT family N-acetyltransferase [Propionibacteriales bacterium]|nr:GNAT family N-acetyltransferase [Propionibacteriales bacterium]
MQPRDLTVDDLDAVIDVRARSIGLMAPGSREEWLRGARTAVAERRLIGVFDGDRLVSAARVWDFTQWWCGRQVPMGGIGGVVVDPEYRGRGVASRLMGALLHRCQERGLMLSALFPAAVPVYRKLGYEFGGGRHRYSFLADELRRLGGGDAPLRRATPDDAALLLDLVTQVRAQGAESGPVGWPQAEVREWLGEEDTFAYVADDGFVVYRWEGSDLQVDELVAGTETTARTLWSIVGSGASIARTVHAYLAPYDPIHLMLGREAAKATEQQRWMLRLIDAPGALAARGWPPGAALDLPIEVSDAEIPANAGRWQLHVADGLGSLDADPGAGRDRLRLSSRGLAALYAGTPMATLRVAGIATGGTADADRRIDAAFGGPAAFMLDYL